MNGSSRWLIIITVFVILLFSGCSKVNQENYQKLSMGMDYKTVISILGEPTHCDSLLNANNCTWGDETKNINIKFIGDKVIFYTSSGL